MSKQELVDKNEVLSVWHNYWESDKLTYEAEDELRELKTIICITELNENQHVVLDWLKEDYSKNRWTSPFGTIYGAIRQHESQIRILPQEQQAQVLQAFSCWVIEQEEAE